MLFQNYLKLFNDSSSSQLEENGTYCTFAYMSSSQLDRMGFGGIAIVAFQSISSSMLLLLAFLMIRKCWNFGRVALVYDADSSLSSTHQMPHAVTTELDKDHGFCSGIQDIFRLRYSNIYERCGDDARHYLSFQRHMIHFLAVASIISLCVLIPVNIMGATSSETSGYFQQTTMTNIQDRDDFLWLHATFGVLLSVCMVCFIGKHSFSIQYQDEDKVKYTICINGLPCIADEETLKKHFSEAYPTCKVDSIHLCQDVSKLMRIGRSRRRAAKKLAHYTQLLQTTGQQVNIKPTPFSCLCCYGMPGCEPRDAVAYYQSMNSKLQEEYKEELEAASQSHIGIAYVTLSEKSMASLILKDFNASLCHRKAQSSVSDQLKICCWSVSGAHLPEDTLWDNMSVRGWKWWVRFLLINVFLYALLLYLTTPEIIVSSLDTSEITKPFYYMNRAFKYFPSLQLWTFSVVLRTILSYSAQYEAHWFKSAENKTTIYKTFSYLIFIVLIGPSFGLRNLYAFLHWTFVGSQDVSSPDRLECLFSPHQGALVVHYVIAATFVANALDLLRIPEFLQYITRISVAKSSADRLHIMQTQAKEFAYAEMYARMLCVITLVMAYCNISPLVVPCGLLYMLIKHVTDMHNLYYVHLPAKQNRGVHEAAVKLSTAAPLFHLMWMLFFCMLRKGFIPLTIVLGVALLLAIVAWLITTVYCLLKGFCKSSYDFEEIYPASQTTTGNISQQSHVYVPSAILNIEMAAEQQNADAIKPQVDVCKFYKHYP